MDPAGGKGRAESPATDDIFQILRDGEPRTRAGLAAMTGLARSTVASRVDALVELGLIRPVRPRASTGGRPPSQFAFNPGARPRRRPRRGTAGSRSADLAAGLLSSRRVELSIADSPDAVLDLVARLATSAADEAGRRRRPAARNRPPAPSSRTGAPPPPDHARLGRLRRPRPPAVVAVPSSWTTT